MKNALRRINEIACGGDGWFLGSCKESIAPSKNYTADLLAAVGIQYVIPAVFTAVLLHVIYAGVISFSVIEIFCSFNPFFVLFYIPVIAVESWIVAFAVIVGVMIIIIYTSFCFKKLGVFSFFPLLSWVTAIALWLVPIAGPILTAMFSAFPWVPAMIIVHWWTYSS